VAAHKDLGSRVRSILGRWARFELGNGARVRVRKSDYRNYIHVYVTSSRFKTPSWAKRSIPIWKCLEAELAPHELPASRS
jgi:hypothetical protein